MVTATTHADWDELSHFVRDARRTHEILLATSQLGTTEGTCLYASFHLQLVLNRFGRCTAVIRGGDGRGDGGLVDPAGALRGHYWVEGVTEAGIAFVADNTADQFGYPAVFIERLEVARARYLPGDDADVNLAVAELVDDMRAAVVSR